MNVEQHEYTDFAPTMALGLEDLPIAPRRGLPSAVNATPALERIALSLPATTPLPDAALPQARALSLFVAGFHKMERQLLEGTVRLSQRRLPRLELAREEQARTCDVVLIDGTDPEAVVWAESQPWLASKTVIWVDSQRARPGHTLLKRPVQWSILPIVLARSMEQLADARALPSEPDRSTATNNPPRPAGIAPVLVVDDSLAVRNHLRSLLEARGLQVCEATCVQAALEVIATTRFACVLMDVLMPDLDGYEGCRRIKSLKSSIGVLPVVMLTSKSSPFDRIRGKMAGCDAYLIKPVEPSNLYEVLARHTVAAPAKVSAHAGTQRTPPAGWQFGAPAAQRA